jgi:hypothetical protein
VVHDKNRVKYNGEVCVPMCAIRAMFRIFEPSVDALYDAYRAPIIDVLHGTICIFVLRVRNRLSMASKEATRSKMYKAHLFMSSSPSIETSNPPEAGPPSTSPAETQSFEHVSSSQPQSQLETQPTGLDLHKGRIPNTPLASATISFLLGSIFALAVRALFVNLGLSAALFDLVKTGNVAGTIAFNNPLVQLSFFFATWSAFHWGEFAMTAGWNRARANVDCK